MWMRATLLTRGPDAAPTKQPNRRRSLPALAERVAARLAPRFNPWSLDGATDEFKASPDSSLDESPCTLPQLDVTSKLELPAHLRARSPTVESLAALSGPLFSDRDFQSNFSLSPNGTVVHKGADVNSSGGQAEISIMSRRHPLTDKSSNETHQDVSTKPIDLIESQRSVLNTAKATLY